ncbi:MAG: hypothetical protein KDD47_08945, partial [Acidobacteria bacterium]|nr:hypothetical protein [Acidobacteriota bacterium]
GKNIILVTAGDYDAFDITNGRIVRGGYNPTFNGRIPAGTRVHGALDSANNTYYGVRANNITSVTKLLDLKINAEGQAGTAASGVIVKNASAKVVLDNVTATAGQGVNPTGVLADNNSKVEILNSAISSGTATGAGSDAYGVRALDGSNVTVNGGTIEAAAGVNGNDASAGAPATPAKACDGGNGYAGAFEIIDGIGVQGLGGSSSMAATKAAEAVPSSPRSLSSSPRSTRASWRAGSTGKASRPKSRGIRLKWVLASSTSAGLGKPSRRSRACSR